MKFKILPCFFIMLFSSAIFSQTVKIEGDVQNLFAKKIYLVNAYYWQNPIDSTPVVNEKFSFNFKFKDNIAPFSASIIYKNSLGKSNILVYKNPLNSKFGTASFFLYPNENIYINGAFDTLKNNLKNRLAIRAGYQNAIMFRNEIPGSIGIFKLLSKLNKQKPQSRDSIINEAVTIIQLAPNSLYLLETIWMLKARLTNIELSKLLSPFSDEVKKYKYFEEIEHYTELRNDPVTTLFKIPIVDLKNRTASIIDTTATINVLIFWASWCTPCRKEIPDLKKLHTIYKNNSKVAIRSISIDKNKNAWLEALNKERMDWPQFIVSSGGDDYLTAATNSTYVPTILFVDNTGKEIKKFVGASTVEEYEKIINKKINEQ